MLKGKWSPRASHVLTEALYLQPPAGHLMIASQTYFLPQNKRLVVVCALWGQAA